MSSFSSLPPGIFTSGSSGRKSAEETEKKAEEKTEEPGTEFPEEVSADRAEEEKEEKLESESDHEAEEIKEKKDYTESNESVDDVNVIEIAKDDQEEVPSGTEFPADGESDDQHGPDGPEESPSELSADNAGDESNDEADEEYNEYSEQKLKKNVSAVPYRIFASLILAAQAASGAYLIFRAVSLGMLPLRYIIVASAVILALASVIFIGLFLTEKRWKKIVSVILCIAITAFSCAGIWYVNETARFKKKSFGTASHVETTTYLVLVRKGRYTTKEQLKGKTVETGPESDTQNEALSKLNGAVSVKNVPVTGYDVLDSDLMKDRTDAVLIENSALSILDETDKGFSGKTSVLMKIRVPRNAQTVATYTGTGEPFTVFISGTDSRGGVKETARSDVDMLLTVNPKTRQVLMTSIPRDSFVTIHGKNAKDKLTHAGLLGISTLTATVKDFMKVDIDYYLKVNFTSVTTLVNELGGIDIYSDQNIKLWTYPGYANKPLSKGWHHMDGKTALAFARERHSYETGDRHRAENQQAVLKAIAGKLMSGKTLTNYANILKSISSMFVTDMPDSLISDLVSQQLSQGGSWKFTSYVIDCTESMRTGGYFMPSRKLYYAIPVQSSVKKARQQIIKMKGESTPSSESSDSTSSKSSSSESTGSSASESSKSSGASESSGSSSSGSSADSEDSGSSKPVTQKEAAI